MSAMPQLLVELKIELTNPPGPLARRPLRHPRHRRPPVHLRPPRRRPIHLQHRPHPHLRHGQVQRRRFRQRPRLQSDSLRANRRLRPGVRRLLRERSGHDASRWPLHAQHDAHLHPDPRVPRPGRLHDPVHRRRAQYLWGTEGAAADPDVVGGVGAQERVCGAYGGEQLGGVWGGGE